MVAAKTLAPAVRAAPPPPTAWTIRTGAAQNAPTSPAPWLTAFAISSPTDCGRVTCGTRFRVLGTWQRAFESRKHPHKYPVRHASRGGQPKHPLAMAVAGAEEGRGTEFC